MLLPLVLARVHPKNPNRGAREIVAMAPEMNNIVVVLMV